MALVPCRRCDSAISEKATSCPKCGLDPGQIGDESKKFDPLEETVGSKFFPVRVEEKYGYIDKTGQLVIEPQYEDASFFRYGRALVKDENGKNGFIDRSGRVFIPCVFARAWSFGEGLSAVKTKRTCFNS